MQLPFKRPVAPPGQPAAQDDNGLLKGMLEQPAQAQPDTRKPAKRRKASTQSIARTLAALFLIAASAYLWYLGAGYTLAWIDSLPGRVDPSEWRVQAFGASLPAGYIIPIGVTTIEMGLIRQYKRVKDLLHGSPILAIDALSTASGIALAKLWSEATVKLPLFGSVGLGGAALGLCLAFLPEAGIRYGLEILTEEWGF
jgi:hypothetical protein